MLTWDEEVKPSLPSNFLQTPQGMMPAEKGKSAPALRTLNDGAHTTVVGVPTSAEATPKRVRAADKRIINGRTDVNQLVPFKYKRDWEK